MSYILDALTKSERERDLGRVPSLATVCGGVDGVRRRRAPAMLLAPVLGLSIGVTVYAVQRAVDRPLATASAPVEPAVGPPVAVTAPVALAARGTGVAGAPPPLDINVVSYSSDAGRRFIMVDQRIYKEGEQLPGGAVIEEITVDGPIVSFAGSRYLKTP